MESDLSLAILEELKCFICLSCLTDPVTISCGHSFCRACLHLSWEDTQLPVRCPMCKEPSQQKYFRTDVVLKKLVSIARQDSLMRYLSYEEQKCVTHKEIKRIFCAENKIYLCHICSDSHEHRGHKHCPIQVFAEGQMERLIKQMASLWKKIQENEENIQEENRMKALWTDYLTLREDMIRTEYRKLHPVGCEEEVQHLERVRNDGQGVAEKLRESEAMMVGKSKQLRDMYQELMAMAQEPRVVLLPGLDDILRRSESMQLSIPQTLKPKLSALPISGLTEKFNLFIVNIFFINISTFHYKTNLFNLLRRLSFRYRHKDTSGNFAGSYLASCGSKYFFTPGKYYWELALNDSLDWAVGVCKDSWLWKRNLIVESEGAFLLVCVQEGNHYSLLTTCPVLHHYLEKPLGRVGVLLDCEDGSLSFLNVAQSSLIYRYPSGTFNYPVWPFFSIGHA